MKKVLQRRLGVVFSFVFLSIVFTSLAFAQLPTATILGVVKDSSGAVVPDVSLTARSVETGQTRTTVSATDGSYRFDALPVGAYEVRAEHPGFQAEARSGLMLTVGQEAVVNMILQVGTVSETVSVTAEAPIVNTTMAPTSGLVEEQEVKDLPLNGRSFDQLLTLSAGTVNYTTAGTGGSGNQFSVAGQRVDSNRFLINGVEYIGTSSGGAEIQPTGASGSLLGVDAVREFNLVTGSYGAEYGKRVGGQVSIVSSSGTNQLHGAVFEYLRNSALDARNTFDYPFLINPGERIPPFKRNQFGGTLGGPIKKDKLFLFGNYEGFRQRLGISNASLVPDNNARNGNLPAGCPGVPILTGVAAGTEVPVPGLKTGMLPFFNLYWAAPNGANLGCGVAYSYTNPLQKIREDFGLTRFDYNRSAKDSFSANFLVDDGENATPTADPLFTTDGRTRSEVIGIQETHVFSSTALNVATVGFSRTNLFVQSLTSAPFDPKYYFVTNTGPGSITIGAGVAGSAAGGTVTGGTGQRANTSPRNYFTWADDFHYFKGNHSFSMGAWIQRVQMNTLGPGGFTSGNVTYPTLASFLQDAPTSFVGTPNPVFVGWRTTEGAWYIQDEMKLKPNLTLRLGLRDEMTSGWNEAYGRAATYIFDANQDYISTPVVSSSALTANNAKALWEPRIGLVWDPTGTGKWAVRAGAGIHYDLQDNLGFRASGNPPFASRVTYTSTPLLSIIPISGTATPPPPCTTALPLVVPPACGIYAPGGVEPNFKTPATQEWSLTIEHGLTSSLMLQLEYDGSESYHQLDTMARNVIRPVVCSNPVGCVSGGIKPTAQQGLAPQGTLYIPPGKLPNPNMGAGVSYWFGGTSSYEALNVTLVKRASHGLTFKTTYSYSKILDAISASTSGFTSNEPAVATNAYNLHQGWGPAAFNLTHRFNGSFSYELPWGHGRRWGSGASPLVDKLIGGWQWNGIATAQSGFPFTVLTGSNTSGNGDTFNPDLASRNPAFSGPIILHKRDQWYNPNAFVVPTNGTFGNLTRGVFGGPRLINFDTSLFKKISINERFNLQFRVETFNIFNHPNYGVPRVIAFSGASISPSAGAITNTATTSRQIQFALKLNF